jgi:hypothetical protein
LRLTPVFSSLLFWTFLATAVAIPLVPCSTAEAKPKKDDAGESDKKGKGKKGKKGKAGKGSMDETAGESDSGGLAPGSDDAKAKIPERKEPEPPTDPAPVSEPTVDPVAETPAEETAPASEPEPAPDPSRIKKNWVSLSVQQDALFFTPISGVCKAAEDGDQGGRIMNQTAPQYSCRDGEGLYDEPVYSGAGNQIQSGLGLATTRILVGYDRVFIDRLTIGGRLGYAFGGAPTVVGGGVFIPWHAELKSKFYFGDKPFERMSFRPFASLAVGIGEVDAKVSVDFFRNQDGFDAGRRGRLDVWRKTGTAFGAVGLGVAHPVGPVVPFLEARGIMMFGESAFAIGLAGGVAYGI